MLCAGRDDVAVTDRDAKIKAPESAYRRLFKPK